MPQSRWLFCPVCRGKTREQVLEDTELVKFPLFCPKCKNVTIVSVRKFQMISEPDAKPQSH